MSVVFEVSRVDIASKDLTAGPPSLIFVGREPMI